MLLCLKASWMNYNLEETKRKEKPKFSKVNGNIKIRYPIYRRGSDFYCFYFSQTCNNWHFPEYAFLDSLLFNWFLLESSIFTNYTCSPIWKWCFQIAHRGLQTQPTFLDKRFSTLIIIIISWIIMNRLFNKQFFSVGDWVRLVCRIIPLRDSTTFILF